MMNMDQMLSMLEIESSVKVSEDAKRRSHVPAVVAELIYLSRSHSEQYFLSWPHLGIHVIITILSDVASQSTQSKSEAQKSLDHLTYKTLDDPCLKCSTVIFKLPDTKTCTADCKATRGCLSFQQAL